MILDSRGNESNGNGVDLTERQKAKMMAQNATLGEVNEIRSHDAQHSSKTDRSHSRQAHAGRSRYHHRPSHSGWQVRIRLLAWRGTSLRYSVPAQFPKTGHEVPQFCRRSRWGMRKSASLADRAIRFTAMFTPEPNSGCWLWTGSYSKPGKLGYGKFQWDQKGPSGAHRVAWMIYRGPIPDGLSVLHRCDTPACVNPDHLFLGTHQDNSADMVSKGRSTLGGGTRLRTHCPKGHAFTAANSHIVGGARLCRACQTAYGREYYRRNRDRLRERRRLREATA